MNEWKLEETTKKLWKLSEDHDYGIHTHLASTEDFHTPREEYERLLQEMEELMAKSLEQGVLIKWLEDERDSFVSH